MPFAPAPPTVAGRLSLLCRAAKAVFAALHLQDLLLSVLSRVDLGVCFSLDGIVIGCDFDLLGTARGLFAGFREW